MRWKTSSWISLENGGKITIKSRALHSTYTFYEDRENYSLVFRNHLDPYSLKVSLSDNEDQQLVDGQALLEGILGRNAIADTIKNALENLRDVVINGNESLPPLDPLVIDAMGPFEFDITGVFINRFEVGVDVRLGTNLLAGHLLLRELDIRLDIADTFIQIDGMTGSSIINTFINSFVQSLTQEIIQNHLEDISQMISEEVFDTINEILKDYTLNDIMG
ncbi:Uncharacterized protein OBRU01_07157 [Operophtera brumata]|uniref:Uncharacterized protein n=1 Tax=Operophtera brumata TaxID=104452 RepID=A0A0L7LJL7_OPEBR|nr:Uncharacterized protein OBRU01_07157 [Operophtera brumata]